MLSSSDKVQAPGLSVQWRGSTQQGEEGTPRKAQVSLELKVSGCRLARLHVGTECTSLLLQQRPGALLPTELAAAGVCPGVLDSAEVQGRASPLQFLPQPSCAFPLKVSLLWVRLDHWK